MNATTDYPAQTLYKDCALFTLEEDEIAKQGYYDLCEDFGTTPTEDGLAAYLDNMNETDYHDLLANISYSKWNDCPCVIVGRLGLWNGNPSIVPVRSECLSDALRRTTQASFASHAEVALRDGCITIHQYHHDGCNRFEIHLLNARGRNVDSDADAERLADSKYWKRIKGYLF